MNIENMLHEQLVKGTCGRCGMPRRSARGWHRLKEFVDTDTPKGSTLLCPACVTDFEWWLSTPPPTDTVIANK